MTDGCIAPDCQRPAMMFPPSRYCKNHCDYVPPNVGRSVTIPPTPHEEFQTITSVEEVDAVEASPFVTCTAVRNDPTRCNRPPSLAPGASNDDDILRLAGSQAVTAFAQPRWGIRVHAVAMFSELVGDEEEVKRPLLLLSLPHELLHRLRHLVDLRGKPAQLTGEFSRTSGILRRTHGVNPLPQNVHILRKGHQRNEDRRPSFLERV
jgi:hypothetical protein